MKGGRVVSAADYVILIEGPSEDVGNYGAWCPDVPGCVATGDTYDDTVVRMREALQGHLELLAEDGDPIPSPSSRAEVVHIAAA